MNIQFVNFLAPFQEFFLYHGSETSTFLLHQHLLHHESGTSLVI